MNITTIGLDLAKSVFQAHGVDEAGEAMLVKKLHRKQMLPFFSKLPSCLIGVEACATAHHWERRFRSPWVMKFGSCHRPTSKDM